MKKLISIALCAVMLLGVFCAMASCSKESYEIAVVTDVGQINDKGFNQGTWEGAEAYAKKNNISVKYYQPANGSVANDNDRIAAMRQAINNGAKVIVTPGYLQATALRTVAAEHPEVKFVFVDGWTITDKVDETGKEVGTPFANITAIVYKEQESGYLAGYAVVKEGYEKLGFTAGGGGTNPACNRFGYGFVQGANAAAAELGKTVTIKYSYKFGDNFSASSELQAQIASWYAAGTEVVFACGGSMFDSVKSAAAEYKDRNVKIVGVDTDQSGESEQVITSAVKELATSVDIVLTQFYGGEWDSKLAGKTQNLGAAENATGLPTATWRLTNFTVEQYKEVFEKIKNGTIVPDANTPGNANENGDWLKANLNNVVIDFEK